MKRLSPFFKRRFALLLVVVLCLSTPQLMSWADDEIPTGDVSGEENITEGSTSDTPEGMGDTESDDESGSDVSVAQPSAGQNDAGEATGTEGQGTEDENSATDTQAPEADASNAADVNAGEEVSATESEGEQDADITDAASGTEGTPTTEDVPGTGDDTSDSGDDDADSEDTPAEAEDNSFVLQEQGDGSWTYAEVDGDGNLRVDENGQPLSTWNVVEVRDPETGEVVGYKVSAEAKGSEEIKNTEEITDTTNKTDDNINGTFEADPDKEVNKTEKEDIALDVKDWLVLLSSGGKVVLVNGEPQVIGSGQNGVTVTMKPGSWDWVGITVDTTQLVGEIQDKLPVRPNDTDTKDYIDPSTGVVTGYQTTSTSQDGDVTVTTTTIVTYEKDESGNIIGYTIVEETRRDGEVVTSQETLEVNQGNPVKESETTEIKLPEGYVVGEHAPIYDETTHNTTTVKVEELYDVDENGNLITDESGNPIVVGYLTTTTVTDENGNEVSSSKESVWGIKTVKSTITIEGTERQKITVTSSFLVTRATTNAGFGFAITDVTGGDHCAVWGAMSGVTSNSSPDSVKMDSIKPDMSIEPDVGTVDTLKDLFNRQDADVQYKIVANTLEIYGGPGTTYAKSPDTLSKDTIVFVSDTKQIKDEVWGRIGTDRWICLSNSSKNAEVTKLVNEENKFMYLGQYGLESSIRVNGSTQGKIQQSDGTIKNEEGSDGGTYQPHQFVLLDKYGNRHYVYCADFQVGPKKDTTYVMTRVEDGNYWSKNNAENDAIADHIEAIAKYGYWGTEKGTGSLEAVKQMMKDAINAGQITTIEEKDVDKLTDGMALTATQAAIWSYATSGKKINVDDPFGKYYTGTGFLKDTDNGNPFTEEEEAVALALYNYLRSQSEKADHQEITANSIKETSITVRELNKDEHGKPVVISTDDPTNTQYEYKTDISFVLDIAPSKINGDLLVKIYKADSEEVIGTWRLAGDDEDDYGYSKVTSSKGERDKETLT